ncbi:MAG: YicC/YloC family endoribonuclease [Pseudomonadota bacterium]
MTGFALEEGTHAESQWVWDARSVNNRGLELRFRLPPGTEHLEATFRKMLSAKIKRGAVNISLQMKSSLQNSTLQVNDAALETCLKAIQSISARIDCDRPRPEAILSLRGVLEQLEDTSADEGRAAFDNALTKSLELAIDRLVAAREQEGKSLTAVVGKILDEIETATAEATKLAENAPAQFKQKLTAQLQELLSDHNLDAERLHQEAAQLAVKADVREELDRLHAHLSTARDLVTKTGPVGRKLDFLTQEFNREANTLCAKAPDIKLKEVGLALKSSIDQLREQIQNIE